MCEGGQAIQGVSMRTGDCIVKEVLKTRLLCLTYVTK